MVCNLQVDASAGSVCRFCAAHAAVCAGNAPIYGATAAIYAGAVAIYGGTSAIHAGADAIYGATAAIYTGDADMDGCGQG
eukprot:3017402-Rhodomonas_salina.1